MNNRATELYKQAGEFAYSIVKPFDQTKLNAVWAGRYAELIIKECSELLVKTATEYDKVPGREITAQAMETAAAIINNHFGVK